VMLFPDWETLPYDLFSPHQDIISDRIRVLHQLPNSHKGILVRIVAVRGSPGHCSSNHHSHREGAEHAGCQRLR